jgi:hypothetical protein
MKFGLFCELQLPAPHEDDDVTRKFRDALERVELADSPGFDCMWATEHHFLDDHALSSAPQVWLAAAAARTKRIRLGHGVKPNTSVLAQMHCHKDADVARAQVSPVRFFGFSVAKYLNDEVRAGRSTSWHEFEAVPDHMPRHQ